MADVFCNIAIGIAGLCMCSLSLNMLSVGNAWPDEQTDTGGVQEPPKKKSEPYLISIYGFPVGAQKVEAFEACCDNLFRRWPWYQPRPGWQDRHRIEIEAELPKYLEDPNPRVVMAALLGLRSYGYGVLKGEAFRRRIYELLKSEDPRIRARTILLVGHYLLRSYVRPHMKPPISWEAVVEAIVSLSPSEDEYYEEMLPVLRNKVLVDSIPIPQRPILLDSLKKYFDKLVNKQYFDSHCEEAAKKFSAWISNPAERPPNPEIIRKAKERARRELFGARSDAFQALWIVGGKDIAPWFIQRLPRKVAYDGNGVMTYEISWRISSYADMSHIDPLIKALSKRADKPKEAKEWYEKTNTLWTVWSILTKKKGSKEGTREFCHLCARLLKSKKIKEREAAIEVFAKWQHDSRTLAMLKEAEVNLDLTKQEAEVLVKAGLKPEAISALTGKE